MPCGVAALPGRRLITTSEPAPPPNLSAIPVPASYLLRRSGETSGPYPRGLLLRHLALGRVVPHDEVSVDGVEWIAIVDVPDLAEEGGPTGESANAGDPAWQEERRRARLRWLDERALPDRRAGRDAPPSDSRSGVDRRADPVPPRKLFGPNDETALAPTGTNLRVVLVVVLVVALAGASLLWFVPSYVPSVRLLQRSELSPTWAIHAETAT